MNRRTRIKGDDEPSEIMTVSGGFFCAGKTAEQGESPNWIQREPFHGVMSCDLL